MATDKGWSLYTSNPYDAQTQRVVLQNTGLYLIFANTANEAISQICKLA